MKKSERQFCLELIKNVDCFLDGHGTYDSNLVPLKKKSLQQAEFFLLQIVRVMSLPKEYKMLAKNVSEAKISKLVRF